jgi:hypothetical protein
MFKPSVDKILTFIARQVAQVNAKRKDVTVRYLLSLAIRSDTKRHPISQHIFMSGGFSDSPYLFKQVQDWAKMKAIEVERGDER